jgi:hypothetical protein
VALEEPRRLHLADGTSKPLAEFSLEEIRTLANGDVAAVGQQTPDIGTFRQILEEMEAFSAESVADLNWTAVRSFEVMLRIRTPEEGLEF